MRATGLLCSGLFALVLSCSGGSSEPKEPVQQDPPPAAAPAELAVGGMWLPNQIPELAKGLVQAGLSIDPESLANLERAPLGAIVSIPGCSASFVSEHGLVITNHHCVHGILTYHSSGKEDLVASGFVARTRADEKWNGPTGRVYVPVERRDVTERVRKGLATISDPIARKEEVERRQKAIVAECESREPGYRCSVSGFFGGGQYRLVKNLEIRDVRLVYAPAGSVGAFGGDTDNWMWPRHAGDFAFLRAYVGKDQKPADYSKDNVPYRPRHWLEVSPDPLKAGDLVISAGYPGRTMRNQPLERVVEAVEWDYPRSIQRYEQALAVLRELEKKGGSTAVVARSGIFGFENRLKKVRGMLDQLRSGGLLDQKKQQRQKLETWLKSNPNPELERGLSSIASLYQAKMEWRETSATLRELADADLLTVASTLVHLAHERAKPDAERKPSLQERNWPRLRGWLQAMDRRYDRQVDIAMLTLAEQRAYRRKDPLVIGLINQGAAPKAKYKSTAELIASLYQRTKLEDAKTRVALFDSATVESLSKSKDPFIKIALALYPLEKELETKTDAMSGDLMLAMPAYVAALQKMKGGPIAPDANRSLRVTFGRVQGYKPRPDADEYIPFTRLSGVVKKDTGKAPFNSPDRLLAAAKSPTRAYDHPALGELPVDFLSQIDLTGGSSGSATLDSKGRLVGLAFDTTLEGVGSDWQFDPATQRAIHVHIRYVLWMMDEVDRAHHLLREMGQTPKSKTP